MSIYNFKYTTLREKEILLEEYKGKVMLLANTASKCGFTPQYEGLENLYKEYEKEGLVVVGFPCDQFNDQEFDTSGEIEEFCKVNYGVTFPLSKKIDVRGEGQDPIFKYLCDNTKYQGLEKGTFKEGFEDLLKNRYGEDYLDSSIKWNFTKFLIDREGTIVERYEPNVEPSAMIEDIKKYL